MKHLILLCCACLLVASDPAAHDWPMWGGTADRNMVSSMTGAPDTWDVKTAENVKWVAKLGAQTYACSPPSSATVPCCSKRPVAVVRYGFWRRRLDGDSHI